MTREKIAYRKFPNQFMSSLGHHLGLVFLSHILYAYVNRNQIFSEILKWKKKKLSIYDTHSTPHYNNLLLITSKKKNNNNNFSVSLSISIFHCVTKCQSHGMYEWMNLFFLLLLYLFTLVFVFCYCFLAF